MGGLTAFAQSVTERDFKKHFDAHGIQGSFLLYDLKANRYTAYDAARCRRGFIFASTFKIPNTIIGLDTGVLPDTNYVFKWDGKPKWLKAWETDPRPGHARLLRALLPGGGPQGRGRAVQNLVG